MAVAPLNLPGYAPARDLDFSSLANLGQVYKQAAADRGIRDAFANGIPTDGAGLSQLGATVGAYNPQLGLSLAQLGMSAEQRRAEQERQARLDERQLSRDAQADKQWAASHALQKAAAARANEDKPLIKEVTDPNTGATSFVRINPRTGELTPLGSPPTSGGYAAGVNPNSAFGKAYYKADAERVSEYMDAGKAAQEGKATLDQIDALRKEAYTGPIIGRAATYLGVPANQALEASTNQLSLDVAQKMKGSLSDKDIAFVKSQVPTAATGGEAGRAASDAIRAGFERAEQRASFYRTWAEHYGNINGADAAWKRYVNENPMTVNDSKALGGRRFNPDYNKDFGQYLEPAGHQKAQQSTGPISKAQYDALPSGSTFTAPDGSVRVKP